MGGFAQLRGMIAYSLPHAQSIIAAFHHGIAASVNLHRWPGLARKGYITSLSALPVWLWPGQRHRKRRCAPRFGRV